MGFTVGHGRALAQLLFNGRYRNNPRETQALHVANVCILHFGAYGFTGSGCKYRCLGSGVRVCGLAVRSQIQHAEGLKSYLQAPKTLSVGDSQD